MNYTLRAKKERNQVLLGYARANPQYTLLELARIFGITPQRVWQILKAAKP